MKAGLRNQRPEAFFICFEFLVGEIKTTIFPENLSLREVLQFAA
jgi:hypothetical protein